MNKKIKRNTKKFVVTAVATSSSIVATLATFAMASQETEAAIYPYATDSKIQILAMNRKYSLGIKGIETANKSNLELFKYALGASNQDFLLYLDGDGNYVMQTHAGTSADAYKGKKVVDVSAAGTANRTNIQQYTFNGSKAQKWKIVQAGDGTYYFKNINANKVIDLSGGLISTIGSNARIYQYNGSQAQKFYIKLIDQPVKYKLANGWYTIAVASNKNYVLDVALGSAKNNANIAIYKNNGTNAQKFYLQYDSNRRAYLIKTGASKGKLGLATKGTTVTGSNVFQTDYTGNEKAYWQLVATSDGTYTLLSNYSMARIVQVNGATSASKTVNKQNAAMGLNNLASNQRFIITKTSSPK